VRWILATIFVGVLLGHFLYATGAPAPQATGSAWAQFEFELPAESRVSRYIGPGEYWLGLSYASAAAFTGYCLARLLRLRRASLAASAGGLTLGGVLWAGVCFFTGCCGSPMLPLYVGLFGPKFIEATKPLTFGITVLSILLSYVWMLKRAQRAIDNNVNTRLHEDTGANPGQV
jgi:hypothetical protein